MRRELEEEEKPVRLSLLETYSMISIYWILTALSKFLVIHEDSMCYDLHNKYNNNNDHNNFNMLMISLIIMIMKFCYSRLERIGLHNGWNRSK